MADWTDPFGAAAALLVCVPRGNLFYEWFVCIYVVDMSNDTGDNSL